MGDNGDNGIELTMIIGDKPHMNYPVVNGGSTSALRSRGHIHIPNKRWGAKETRMEFSQQHDSDIVI